MAPAPNGPRALLAIVFVTSALIGLNATMLNVVLPDSIADLGATTLQGSWMLLAYMLVNGAALVLMGQISDLYEPRPVFLAGLVTFASASAVLVVAPGPVLFIVARAVQGAGAAMLLANSAAIVALVYRGPQLAGALGVYLAGFAVAQVAGPSVGGIIGAVASWRWIFLLTLLVCLTTLVVAWRITAALPSRPPEARRAGVDWTGNALIFVGVSALLYGLSRAQDAGWLSAPVLWPIGASLVLGAFFVAVERRASNPAVDLVLLRQRTFALANLAGGALILPRLVAAIMLSLYFQGVQGDGPATAALKITPLPAGVAIGSLLGARLGRYGERRSALALATVVLAGVAAIPVTLALDVLPGLMVVIAVVGAACGAFATLNTATIMGSAALERAGNVNAIRTLFQVLGTMIGTSVMLGVIIGGVPAAQATRFLAGERRRLLPATVDLLDHNYAVAFGVMALVVLGAVLASASLAAGGRGRSDGISVPAISRKGLWRAPQRSYDGSVVNTPETT